MGGFLFFREYFGIEGKDNPHDAINEEQHRKHQSDVDPVNFPDLKRDQKPQKGEQVTISDGWMSDEANRQFQDVDDIATTAKCLVRSEWLKQPNAPKMYKYVSNPCQYSEYSIMQHENL